MRLTPGQAKALGIGGKAPGRPAKGLPGPTEAEFQRQVIALAKLHGWWVAHFRPGLTRSGAWVTAVQADGAGFPDLLMIRGRVQLAVELKTKHGRLSIRQADWLNRFRGVEGHVFTYCWRPENWDAIVYTLENL